MSLGFVYSLHNWLLFYQKKKGGGERKVCGLKTQFHNPRLYEM